MNAVLQRGDVTVLLFQRSSPVAVPVNKRRIFNNIALKEHVNSLQFLNEVKIFLTVNWFIRDL